MSVQFVTVDHMRLVKRKPKEIAKWLRSVKRGSVTELTVEHEANDSCCKREAWLVTQAFLIENQAEKVLVVLP